MGKILLNILLLFFVITTTFSQSKVDSIDYYSEKKELIKAINYAKKKSDNYLIQKKYADFCKISVRKSKLFGTLNDHEKALVTLYNALSISEKNKLKGRAEIIEQIATRYSIVSDTARAFKNYYKAKHIALIEKDTSSLIHVYHNLFRLHTTKSIDSSYYYMKKKFVLDKLTNSISGLSFSYNNHFVYYTLINEKENAKSYLDSSYNFAVKHNIKNSIIGTLSNYGYYYMQYENDFKKGAETYEKIKNEYKDDLTTFDYVELYLNLVYAYEQIGDYKKANFYSSLAYEYSQKLYNENLSDKIREIETKYNITKVEDEYKEKSKQLEERQSRNKKIIFIFVALFGFSLVLFYFFYQNLQLKQRNKIKELDSEIQENIINASIDGQEKERKKLSEVLHDNISALLSSAGLHLSAYLVGHKDEIPEEILKARSLLKEAHDQVRDLSHELVPPVLAKLGLYYAVQDLCEKNSNSIINFTFNYFGSNQKRYNEEFEIKVYFIITELVNNIVKHSKATSGYITLEERNNQIIINVEDNGKGFDSTKTYNSDGFGLTQIKARVKNLKGKITINSKLNAGTLVYIKLHIPDH
ncbi:MAG TPA: ATP-binding protein [Flavobacterium sp.]|uniref:sensor histidine kinase n=2 Tax=Flavobacterium TaxID=237 RepID=UPI0025C2299B|nr:MULTISPECIES: ATP-binding protein [unclassified Flavobacterium]HRE76718.1 ATP-binding protein [Flavobacterium sp.]